jgi:magnesium-transporting ATPase (P-type)
VFNTFVFLQVANLWNARKIDNEWNVFSGAFSSWLWWIVLGFISVTQTLLVHFGGQALRCHKDGLTAIQWLICLSFALGGLVVGFLLHFIPAEDLTFIPQAGKKETDILAMSANVALASRGRYFINFFF